jgi:hypothetical protein
MAAVPFLIIFLIMVPMIRVRVGMIWAIEGNANSHLAAARVDSRRPVAVGTDNQR